MAQAQSASPWAINQREKTQSLTDSMDLELSKRYLFILVTELYTLNIY